MTGDAVRVAVVFAGVGGNGGINQVVLIIVHVHLINTRHGVDDVKGILEVSFVVLKHRPVKRSLNDRTDVVPALPDDRIQVFFIYRSENKNK